MDWTDNEDCYMADYRGESYDCRPRCGRCGATLEPESGACADCTPEPLPCPICDGPIPMTEPSTLCESCLEDETLLQAMVQRALDAVAATRGRS